MARSLRSKRRQKNNRVRRKKFGERETLKAWDHYNSIRARKSEEKTAETSVVDLPPSNNDEEVAMETGKISKKEIAKWSLSRNQKNKLAKLRKAKKKGNKFKHSHKHH